MPSENKTNNYGLNQWQGNEYLKREDLNTDNEIIDVELKNVNDKTDSKISRSLATAANQFLLSSAVGQWAVKTIDEIKALLGLGSAAYTNSTAYATAAQGIKADNAATQAAFNTHVGDYVRQPGYAITTGSANTYNATLNPSPILVDGTGIVVKIHAANTGASTLNVNGLGAKPIIDSKGNFIKAGKLLYGRIYSLKYDGVNFQLQGEGGEIPKLTNLIKNGSFESNANSWTLTGATTIVSTGAKFGTKALYHNGTGAVVDYAGQPIPVKAGHRYIFSAWIKNLSNVGAAIDVSTKGSILIPPSTDYTYGSVEYVATANEVVNFVVGWHNAVSNGGGVWVDGVMLLDLTEAFGVGNEPSKAEVDASIQTNGGWWDSDLSILTADATANKYHGIQGTVYYSKGERVVGEIPNRTFEATGGAYTHAAGYKCDGPGTSLLIQPQNGYYVNQVNAGGFGPIIIQDPNFIPANIVSGKSIFGVTGTFSGKRWYKGTGTSIAGGSFLYENGVGFTAGCLQLSTNLGFTPRVIMVSFDTIGGYATIVSTEFNFNYTTDGRLKLFVTGLVSNGNGPAVLDGVYAYLNNSGFRLPVRDSNTSYTYIIYE